MSATLIPTRTSGARPPVPPPTATTFDGAPGGDDWLSYLRDDVRMICRHADAAQPSGLDTMLGLLARREKLVASEIWAIQATEGEGMDLPPIRGLSIDYLIESPTREQRILQGLLDQLYECRTRCERRLLRFHFEARLSRDLDASDS